MNQNGSPSRQILVVSTDTELADRITTSLAARSLQVRRVGSLTDALISLQAKVPDLVVLAGSLANAGCYEVCRQLRDISKVPLFILCDDVGIGHVADALGIGADDHVPTTIDIGELEARALALLRRNQLAGQLQAEILQAGMLRLDGKRATCAVNGGETRLTPYEFKLIRALATRSGEILSHDELIEQIWGSPYHGSGENLRKLVQRTRSTLAGIVGPDEVIAAVPGFGYRLEIADEAHVD